MFFRHGLAVCLFLLCCASSRGQLQWDSSTMFVAASPDEGKAVARFTFTNTGSRPVKITGTKTTCGCTAAVAEQRVFMPNEKGALSVSFKTLNRNGLYEEPVSVFTDDPAARETLLKLRVLVRDVIEVQPALVFWRAGEPLTPKTIRVKVTEGFAVKQIEAGTPDPNVAVRVETLKAGSEYAVVVTPKAPRIKTTLSIRPDYPATGGGPKVFTAHVRAG
jgi:hypothetical protein